MVESEIEEECYESSMSNHSVLSIDEEWPSWKLNPTKALGLKSQTHMIPIPNIILSLFEKRLIELKIES